MRIPSQAAVPKQQTECEPNWGALKEFGTSSIRKRIASKVDAEGQCQRAGAIGRPRCALRSITDPSGASR
jgi:hypothetical protein